MADIAPEQAVEGAESSNGSTDPSNEGPMVEVVTGAAPSATRSELLSENAVASEDELNASQATAEQDALQAAPQAMDGEPSATFENTVENDNDGATSVSVSEGHQREEESPTSAEAVEQNVEAKPAESKHALAVASSAVDISDELPQDGRPSSRSGVGASADVHGAGTADGMPSEVDGVPETGEAPAAASEVPAAASVLAEEASEAARSAEAVATRGGAGEMTLPQPPIAVRAGSDSAAATPASKTAEDFFGVGAQPDGSGGQHGDGHERGRGAGGGDGRDGGDGGELYDHAAAKKQLARYRKEAEERVRRKAARREREAQAFREQMAVEEEKIKQRAQEREALIKQKQAERLEKQREARLAARRAREAVLQSKSSVVGPKRTPLYKRMQNEHAERQSAEESKRQQVLKEKHAQFKPIDFEELRRQAQEKQGAGHRGSCGEGGEGGEGGGGEGGGGEGRHRAGGKDATLGSDLPPVTQGHRSNYYHGAARDRVLKEHMTVRKQVEIQRQAAAAKRQATKGYVPSVSRSPSVSPVRHREPTVRAVTAPGTKPSRLPAAKPVQRTNGSTNDNGLNDAQSKAGTTGHAARIGNTSTRAVNGTKSAPVRVPSEEAKVLSERARVLNRAAHQIEAAIDAHLAAAEPPSAARDETILESRAQLNATYIDAIQTKLKLLEMVRAQ